MMNVYKSLQTLLSHPEEPSTSAEPKGIGSILSENVEAKQSRNSQSLRRTLSADMSSQGWMARENPLRKTCSFYELSCNSDSESEHYSDSDDEDRNDEEEQDVFPMSDDEEEDDSEDKSENEDRHPWSVIRSQNQQHQQCSDSSFFSLFQSTKEIKSDPYEPCKPYVQPKKKSTLSDQSLRVCTEALGCESGADCSYFDDSCSSSEDSTSVFEEEEENHPIPLEDDGNADNVWQSEPGKEVIYGAKSTSSGKSFPPPLSSISRSNGPCVYMRSYKQDGRLLLKAVKVESQKYLQAYREDGRLQLHFIRAPEAQNCSNSHEEEFNAQNFPPEQKQQQPQPQHHQPPMFSNLSNSRRHILRSDIPNVFINKELFPNLNLNSSGKDSSLFKEPEVKGSNYSNDFHLKSSQPNFKQVSNSESFCKTPASSYTGRKKDLSQSLITSPSLLNYPLNGVRYSGGDVKESAHSLPKFPLNEGFRRCKERGWFLNWEMPYCIAIS